MEIDLHGKTHPEGLELIEEYMLLNSTKGSVSLKVITGNYYEGYDKALEWWHERRKIDPSDSQAVIETVALLADLGLYHQSLDE